MPDLEASLADGAIAPWAGGQSAEYFGRLLEGLANAVGFRMDTPWRKLPADRAEGGAARQHGPGARPLPQPVRPRALLLRQLRGRHPVPRAAARPDGLRLRSGRSTRATCATCRARRARARGSSRRSWPSRWPTATQGERSIAEVSAMSVAECSEFLDGMLLDARQTHDRRADPQGGAGPAGLPARRRAALPVARPRRGLALRRRGAAHPAGHPDRLRAGRACCTCSTSRRSGCTSATTAG